MRRPKRKMLKSRWARQWNNCVVCGASDKPHHAMGLCHSCYQKQLYRTNKDYKERAKGCSRLRGPRNSRILKTEVIQAYGGKCECCGETRLEFLTIDHINGRKNEKTQRKLYGRALYYHLREVGWPKNNIRILCWNCNCSLGLHGYCPHQQEKVLNADLNNRITPTS